LLEWGWRGCCLAVGQIDWDVVENPRRNLDGEEAETIPADAKKRNNIKSMSFFIL
jgi:hypothetical protein